MPDLSPQQLEAVRNTLASPGWAVIRAEINEALEELDVTAHVQRDPFVSGKCAAEAFGVRKALRMIEAIPSIPLSPEGGEEEYEPPFGEDLQQHPQPTQ